ncbi:hypothetical protein L486_00511 [Kwoniella mangroviensis CBS 10435]|uniref:Uncharacterized protein n=1 Tax=Kwoniella mangroviensis CBS 10435 TaxID=1331196 RepID=A0A1B9IZB2_9TREE|nr:hypothetical protein L486_00511 [Kwoniella mangroviensis CBS 10435]
MPRKKSQARKVEVNDRLVNLFFDTSIIDIGSLVGSLSSRSSETPRTSIPNIRESGRGTQATTTEYTSPQAHNKRQTRRSVIVKEKELGEIQLSETYAPKEASFASLRIMDWSRINECWTHSSEECWYHKRINCVNHRKPTHFSHPIRYPFALGRGLRIGLCKECEKLGRDCSVSSENDRFYGLSDSLYSPPTIHRIDISRGKLIEGKVYMKELVRDSDGNEGEDEDEDKREGRRFDCPQLANTTLKRGSKRPRPIDLDSDLEENIQSHSRASGDKIYSVTCCVIPHEDYSEMIVQSDDDHDYQDPDPTLRDSAFFVSGSALPDSFTIPSTSTRTLPDDEPKHSHFASIDELPESSNNNGSAPTRYRIPTSARLQLTRLRNKLRDQDERLDRVIKGKDVIMAKLEQVYMKEMKRLKKGTSWLKK